MIVSNIIFDPQSYSIHRRTQFGYIKRGSGEESNPWEKKKRTTKKNHPNKNPKASKTVGLSLPITASTATRRSQPQPLHWLGREPVNHDHAMPHLQYVMHVFR